MAATLAAQRDSNIFTSLTQRIPQNIDAMGESSEGSENQEVNQDHSVSMNSVPSEESSDEEITVKSKTNKAKRRSIRQVMSDDSDDENIALADHNESNPKESEEEEMNPENSEKSNASSDSDDVLGSINKSKNFKKKKRKVVSNDTNSDDDDDDDDVPLKASASATRSRRQVKERKSQSSVQGNAIKKLMKKRKKKRGEKIKDSGDESNDNNESVMKNNSEDEPDSQSSSNKKSRKKSKAKKNKILEEDKDDLSEVTGVGVNEDNVDARVNGYNVDEELYEDSESQDSDNYDEDNNKPVKRKTYGTRRKCSAMTNQDEIDEEEERKQSETIAIFNNTDLFDAEGSDTGDERQKSSADDDDQEIDEMETKSKKKKRQKEQKKDKPKKMTKAQLMEMESESQRLFRNSKINIPHHEPAPVSIHQFLQRVPKLDSLQKKSSTERANGLKDSCKIENFEESSSQGQESGEKIIDKKLPKNLCLKSLPKLTKTSDEIVLDIEEDKKPMAAPSGLDIFMQRLKKHTITPKEKASAKMKLEEGNTPCSQDQITPVLAKHGIINKEKIAMASDTPGLGHFELKKQLQREMRARREANRKEAETRHKLENEEISDNEEEEECEITDEENGDDDNDTEKNENEKERKEKKSKMKQQNDCSDDEDDEELRRWNVEDERKQIETQMDDLDDIDKEYENAVKERQINSKDYSSYDENTTASARTVGGSLDLFPGVRNDEDMESNDRESGSLNLEIKENTGWDESNTIPPGQGDSFRVPNRIDASTPFSKLLKSGLFSSRRRSSASDDHSVSDSYKDDSSQSNGNTSGQAAAVISDDLHFTLDENTQFSQILDSQGYFNNGKKEKKKPIAKSLFDADDGTSVSQLLGLCSGKFDSSTTQQTRSSLNDDNFGLPSDLPCDKETEEENSQMFLDLCSGKFATQASEEKIEDNCSKTSLKPQSVSELFDKETYTSESQLMHMCSGNFATAATNHRINQSVFEESKSNGSLMKHFQTSESVPLQGRQSFDNLFGKKSNENFCLKADNEEGQPISSHFETEDHTNSRDSQRKKIFFIGNKKEEHGNSDSEERLVNADESEVENGDGDSGIVHDGARRGGDRKFGNNEEETESEERIEDEEDMEDKDEENQADGDENIDEEQQDKDEGDEYDDEEALEEEDLDEEQDEEDVDEELQEYYKSLPKKKYSKKFFYENEAELSGSDVSEDEDEHLGSEADEYEEESDVEVLPSRSKLHAQVHKAHMKATLEDDKQEIRFIQERFYEDGDLLSDSNGRRRNFRWRNIDKTSEMDPLCWDDSDGEAEHEHETESQQEVKKRIERLEREAFLEEQRKSKEELVLDENSQSILNIIKGNDSQSSSCEASHFNNNSIQHSSSLRRMGSFLERNKNTLTRLSSITSNGKKPNAPARSFVFQAKSSSNSSKNDNNDASKKIRRSLSESESPAPKKTKLDKTLTNQSGKSIFKYF